MSAYDYYNAARTIAGRLSATGLPEWPKRIEASITTGGSSGEILMAIRWNLQELLKARLELPIELTESVQDLVARINSSGV